MTARRTVSLLLVALLPGLIVSCAGTSNDGVFVFHDPGGATKGRVSKNSRPRNRPAQTVVFMIGEADETDPESGVGGIEVKKGTLGYWTDEAGTFGGASNVNDVRRRTLKNLNFSKSTPIYLISPSDFSLLLSRLEAKGLRTLPKHRNTVPPKNEPYLLLQTGRSDPEIFLSPNLDALSARMARGEITREEAHRLAKSFFEIKVEAYNFGQASLLGQ